MVLSWIITYLGLPTKCSVDRYIFLTFVFSIILQFQIQKRRCKIMKNLNLPSNIIMTFTPQTQSCMVGLTGPPFNSGTSKSQPSYIRLFFLVLVCHFPLFLDGGVLVGPHLGFF